MVLFSEETHRTNCLLILVIGLSVLSEGVIYQESLKLDDLISLFADEDCIEGSFSVTESGDPVINPGGYVSNVPSVKNDEKNTTLGDKSPMSLVYELAEFNQIKVLYTLTHERGPAHKKQFVVSLKLGEENYVGEGASIKKAQHEASKLALNSTLYGHPPKRDKPRIVQNKKTPVQKLDDWARKHNDALVTYNFFEQSQLMDKSSHKNYYHSGMYSKAKNIHKARVTIANKVFSGEGFSLESAKQNAASRALDSLQSADGFCMLSDKEKSFFSKVLDSDSENPISLVHEFGKISNMIVSFDLVSEEGPSHIKRFEFRCNVGDSFESFGEGSSKKIAKREAAENMIEKLKIHATFNKIDCVNTPKRTKSKKKKTRNLIKSVNRLYSDEDEEGSSNVEVIPDNLDPVSKLFQIQQAKHEVPPVFTLLESTNKEFSFEVSVNDLTATGTGTNKKAAKKNAAKAMLEKLGYSSSYKKDHSISQEKKNDFSKGSSAEKHLAPGINLKPNKPYEIPNTKESSKYKSDDSNNKRNPKLKEKLNNDPESQKSLYKKDKSVSQPDQKKSESNRKSGLRPKSQLVTLSQEIGFKFQFSDFPKANNTGFVSLISLTTDPPKVCYGLGETSDQAQDKAALNALGSLYKEKLHQISQILEGLSSASPKSEIPFNEEDNLVWTSLATESD